ncbi:cysteine hydrolase family protein [Cupriavidus basilensis]|uniref:cysteine hydrolase family protein n=1 Tax=Cupriavidus basilensis TaxID=68895 RepID=UPI0002F92292|nr:cysteine hydrolase family protein [Cupriavidus basilensis]
MPSSASPGRSALLIIDMQVGMFNGPQAPYEGPRVLATINALIAKAREAGAPVFAVRHTGPQGSALEPGSALSQLLPELAIDAVVDTVFDKARPNCFTGTGLAGWLADARVAELVIAGMKTEYCVDTTCRAAAELGFRPVLVADGHTCMDTPVLPAKAIIAHHNRTLSGPFVKLVNAAECRFTEQ